MIVNLYNFSKKANSTAIPDGAGTAVDMSMRSGFSVHSPVLEYAVGSAGLAYNYMYIADTGKYYYITKFEFNAEENFFEVQGEVDVLATYRTQILASTQFVLRWSGSEDVTIIDNMASTLAQPYVRAPQHMDIPWTMSTQFQTSCVVLSLAGSGRICMTGLNYARLMQNFTKKTDPLDVGTYFTRDIARILNNPASYITNAICIPISAYGGTEGVPVMAGSGAASFHPLFGWYEVPETDAYWVREVYGHFEGTVGVGIHPQATSNNDYLNYPPYTDIKIYVAGIGIIAIDGNKLGGAENLRIQGTIDYNTGGITVRVKKESSNTVIGYATGQIGYTLATTQTHSADMVGAMGNVLMGSVFGGATGGGMGAVMGGASGVLNGISSLGNNAGVTVHGSTGGAGAWYDVNGQFISVMETFKRVRKPPASLVGLPYNQSAVLSTLNGFVVCATGAVVCKGTEAEKIKISNYLKGGVYLE